MKIKTNLKSGSAQDFMAQTQQTLASAGQTAQDLIKNTVLNSDFWTWPFTSSQG